MNSTNKNWALVRLNSCEPIAFYKSSTTAARRGERDLGYGRYEVISLADLSLRRTEQVTVTNIMTGKEVSIPRYQVGGPCDPSTERYWSM